MQTKQYTDFVLGFWTRRFGCDDLDIDHPHTFINPDAELAGKSSAIIYRIGKMSVLRISPDLWKKTDLETLFPIDQKAITEAGMQEVLAGDWHVKLKSTLLDWFLDAKDYQPHLPPGVFVARQVHPGKDDAILHELYAEVTAEDLDEAEIYVDEPDPVIFGLFNGKKMIAYASHRYWEDVICDIGVLVHPDYRSLGLGKAVVSTLCGWCIENEKIPMYRVFDDHSHSVRIPEALGFQKLVTVMSISIEEEKE